MKILIFNNQMRRRETYTLNELDDMPYTSGGNVLVRDFLGDSMTTQMWSTAEFLQSMQRLNRVMNYKVPWMQGFRRAHEIASDEMMIHSRGTAADLGHSRFCPSEWQILRGNAEAIQCFDAVSDLDPLPNLVHVHHEPNMVSPMIPFARVQANNIGVDVCVLQDSLWRLGYPVVEIDGCFGRNTFQCLRQFQKDTKIHPTGIADRVTWGILMRLIAGNPFYGEPDYPDNVN